MRLLTAALVAAFTVTTVAAQSPSLRSNDGRNRDLGSVNRNRYDPDSVSNPYGRHGSRYSPDSVNNPYGTYGSPYSPYSATNPYATHAPKIVTPDGKYLGKFSSNPYDADSVSNPYGRFGSRYSGESINNPYGRHGSPYSAESVNNPYATGAGTVKSRRAPDSILGEPGGLFATPNPYRTPRSSPALPTLPRIRPLRVELPDLDEEP